MTGQGTERPEDSGARLRVLVSETAAGASRPFRWALIALVALGGAFALWTYREERRLQREVTRLVESLRQAEEARQRFERRIAEVRKRGEEDRHRTAEFRQKAEALSRELAAAASGEVQSLRDELTLTRTRLDTLEDERAAGERIIRDYGAGVCLIQGTYGFQDSSGRPLRYQVDEEGKALQKEDGSEVLSVEAAGPLHTVSFLGTGFLAERSGLVLTNRHVAEPWRSDKAAQALASTGFKAHFTALRAFFPREKEPLDMKPERVSETADLAVLRVDVRGRKIPLLPLDQTGRGAVPGQPVVVVGYPTGLEAILAKADSETVNEILEAHGTSSERVTEALSQRGLIRPSTTQGHIGDVTKTDIVFDAPTTLGGSGGPVFNKYGAVVAVEYAVLPKFGGNAFGIPIHFALDLLKPPRKPRKTD